MSSPGQQNEYPSLDRINEDDSEIDNQNNTEFLDQDAATWHQRNFDMAHQWLSAFYDRQRPEDKYSDMLHEFTKHLQNRNENLVLSIHGKPRRVSGYGIKLAEEVKDRIEWLCMQHNSRIKSYIYDAKGKPVEPELASSEPQNYVIGSTRCIGEPALPRRLPRLGMDKIATIARHVDLHMPEAPSLFEVFLSKRWSRSGAFVRRRDQGNRIISQCVFRFWWPWVGEYPVVGEGASLQRERAKIRTGRGEQQCVLLERRIVVNAQIQRFRGIIASAVVTLRDANNDPEFWEVGTRYDLSGKALGLQDCLSKIRLALEKWHSSWEYCLGEIGSFNQTRMRDSLNDQKWESFMFDESFQLSKRCFTMIQLLAFADDWVQTTENDLKGLIEGFRALADTNDSFSNMFDEQDHRQLEKAYHEMEEYGLAAVKSIREKISRKSAQSKVLQDVLFNATSLRETTRGMALNRAIYVFTVVTVFYTPLAFIMAFWALPFMSTQDKDGNTTMPNGFILSSVLVPVATYVLAILFAIYVGSTRFRGMLHALWELAKRPWVRSREDEELIVDYDYDSDDTYAS